ncbi:MAG: outer membrane homotrimeric porin [Deltaproteobacteria bacterium]|jgi:hypothetical protein|nr:outer membrane homotrimeric porin [Deltaproteobacteria bacterium]
MKRVYMFIALAALLLGGTLPAAAAAIKFEASGFWHAAFILDHDLDFDGETTEDSFYGANRLRILFSAQAGEHVKGNWEFQGGTWEWGASGEDTAYGEGGDARLDTSSQDLKTRLAWLDVTIPDTETTVSAGIVQLTLPNAVAGNPVFDDRVGGVIVNSALSEEVKLSAFWVRPFFSPRSDKQSHYNSMDLFGVFAEAALGTGWVSPYFVYGEAGHRADQGDFDFAWAHGPEDSSSPNGYADDNKKTILLFGGLALELSPAENLSLKLDAIYGNAKNPSKDAYETEGYMLALGVDYELEFGTPGLIAWYSSGANRNGQGVLPVIGTDGGVGYTRLGMAGTASLGADSLITNTAVGTTGLALQVADISFLESLSHTVRLGYILGTNHKEAGDPEIDGEDFALYGISRELSFVELDFDTTYELVENFSALLELSYVIPMARGDFKRGYKNEHDNKTPDNAFNGQLYLMFDF